MVPVLRRSLCDRLETILTQNVRTLRVVGGGGLGLKRGRAGLCPQPSLPTSGGRAELFELSCSFQE
jgi:hypothetical protein